MRRILSASSLLLNPRKAKPTQNAGFLNSIPTAMSWACQICSSSPSSSRLRPPSSLSPPKWSCMATDGDSAENADSGKDFGSLKILSYNVRFWRVKLRRRMKAISKLVRVHSPDFIGFQEITANIYDIFKESRWWNAYRRSVSSEKAYSRPYFCMLLSKLPVKSFSNKPFSNSIMGRELCTAEVEVGGKSLAVATSHLESPPRPSRPQWDQMYSKERVLQASEALNLLKKYPNVVFGGDMNWDDELDGQYPLQDGWIDAWSELRPWKVVGHMILNQTRCYQPTI